MSHAWRSEVAIYGEWIENRDRDLDIESTTLLSHVTPCVLGSNGVAKPVNALNHDVPLIRRPVLRARMRGKETHKYYNQALAANTHPEPRSSTTSARDLH